MSANSTYNDKDLFSRIAIGNEQAFEDLFHKYVPEIKPLVLKIVQSEEVVKDLVQEIFYYLWKDREKLAEVNDPRAWMFRITYNRSFKYLRKKLLEQTTFTAKPGFLSAAEQGNLTEDRVSFSELSRLLKKAVENLPPQSRKIYELHKEADMKPAAIAKELNLSTQYVRNSLSRSTKTLKDFLEQQGLILPLMLLVLIIE